MKIFVTLLNECAMFSYVQRSRNVRNKDCNPPDIQCATTTDCYRFDGCPTTAVRWLQCAQHRPSPLTWTWLSRDSCHFLRRGVVVVWAVRALKEPWCGARWGNRPWSGADKESCHVRDDPDFIRPLRVRIRRSHCSLHMFASHRRSSRLITDNYIASAANMFKGSSGSGRCVYLTLIQPIPPRFGSEFDFTGLSTTVLQSTSFLSWILSPSWLLSSKTHLLLDRGCLANRSSGSYRRGIKL